MGDILIEAGEEPSGVFYIDDGVVRRYAVTIKGEELTLNVYKSGSIFPVSWVLNDALSRHYYEAMTPVTVYKAPKIEVKQFIRQEPDVLLDIATRIYRGVESLFQRMEYLMVGSAKNKLVLEILISARRFGEKKANQTVVKLKLTSKDLAALAGISRETVSRELRKLEQKNLISFKDNTLTIFDLTKLESELQTL